jgi:flagellar biosynthesis protein FlhF
MLIDVSLEPTDAVSSITTAVAFLGQTEVNSIVAIPGGASSIFIRGQAKAFHDINPRLALTKLDECDVSSIEMSEFFLNSMKIHYLTGSKSVVGGLSSCTSEILGQYLIENC